MGEKIQNECIKRAYDKKFIMKSAKKGELTTEKPGESWKWRVSEDGAKELYYTLTKEDLDKRNLLPPTGVASDNALNVKDKISGKDVLLFSKYKKTIYPDKENKKLDVVEFKYAFLDDYKNKLPKNEEGAFVKEQPAINTKTDEKLADSTKSEVKLDSAGTVMKLPENAFKHIQEIEQDGKKGLYVWLPARTTDEDFEKQNPERVKKEENKKFYLTELPMPSLRALGTPDLENYNGNGWIRVKGKDGSIQAFKLNYHRGNNHKKGIANPIRQQDLPAYADMDIRELLSEKSFVGNTSATPAAPQTPAVPQAPATPATPDAPTASTNPAAQATPQAQSKLPGTLTPDQVIGGNVQSGGGYYTPSNGGYAGGGSYSDPYRAGYDFYNSSYNSGLSELRSFHKRYQSNQTYLDGMREAFLGLNTYNTYDNIYGSDDYAYSLADNINKYIEQTIKDTLKSLGVEKTQETQEQKTGGLTEEDWKEVAKMLDEIQLVLSDDKNEHKGLEITKLIVKFTSIKDPKTGEPKYSREFIMDAYKQAYHANDDGSLIQDIRENVPNNTGLTDADDLVRLLNAPELKFKEYLNYDNPADIVKGEKDKEANVGATTGWGLALSGLATAGTGLLRNAFGTKGKIVLALITALAGTGITTGLAGQAEKKNKQREEQGKEYKEYKEGLK